MRRAHAVRLQHPEGIDAAPRTPPSRRILRILFLEAREMKVHHGSFMTRQ